MPGDGVRSATDDPVESAGACCAMAIDSQMHGDTKDDTCPLGVFMVESGCKGDHLLFRFPFATPVPKRNSSGSSTAVSNDIENPYAVIDESFQAVAASAPHSAATSDIFHAPGSDFRPRSSSRADPYVAAVMSLSDKVLSDLFAVKPQLCDQKFEVKINDIRFVGHPINFGPRHLEDESKTGDEEKKSCRPASDLLTVSIIFALKASASHDIVNCYHTCSQRISIGLQFEERRVSYLSEEAKKMLALHDESADCPHELILNQCPLARTLSKVFTDLSSYGTSHVTINRWMSISLCLPQKVHLLALQFHDSVPLISPERIAKCLQNLRPYHGLVLIVDPDNLTESLPQDSSPAFLRVIRSISPVKNLQELSADCDISLSQVFHIASQLVFWGKACIIFPLCENNKYTIHPLAPTHIYSELIPLFAAQYDSSILRFMSEFSQAVTIKELKKTTEKPSQLVEQIVWLLKHRLLLQLHYYVYFVPERRKRVHYSRLIMPSPYKGEDDPETVSCISSEVMGHMAYDAQELDTFIREIKDSRDRDRFRRLCPYFDGTRHLEDIMFYEDIQRSELMSFLERHENVLLMFEHDDTAISQLCPYNHMQ